MTPGGTDNSTRPMSSRDPFRILDTVCAYWQSEALHAAIDLDIFTAIGPGARTAASIAARCAASGHQVERLCDYLVALGFLHKRAGRYRAAADAARFLDRRSPDAASVALFYRSSSIQTAFAGLARTVRGQAAARSDRRDLWPTFARATLPLKRLEAKALADELVRQHVKGHRLMDVGSGASALGIELLRRWPKASLTVQDSADVVAIALEHAKHAGVRRRVSVLEGDVRAVQLGGPFDVVLMTNVLDYFHAAAKTRLLRRLHQALTPGGVLALNAPTLHPGRRALLSAASYHLLLLALRVKERPLTTTGLTHALRAAGFSEVVRSSTQPLVLARKRR
jgi:2-polyprenyl-3-methyl-5-hydroxy-6-metoxy-1,4-benzoquinol methylase